MSATNDQVIEELRKLSQRVARLEQLGLDNLGTTVNEHDDRLDEHERQLESLATSMVEMRQLTHGIGANVARLTETLTADSLGLQRVELILERDRAGQEQRDIAINGALQKLIGLVEPKAVAG